MKKMMSMPPRRGMFGGGFFGGRMPNVLDSTKDVLMAMSPEEFAQAISTHNQTGFSQRVWTSSNAIVAYRSTVEYYGLEPNLAVVQHLLPQTSLGRSDVGAAITDLEDQKMTFIANWVVSLIGKPTVSDARSSEMRGASAAPARVGSRRAASDSDSVVSFSDPSILDTLTPRQIGQAIRLQLSPGATEQTVFDQYKQACHKYSKDVRHDVLLHLDPIDDLVWLTEHERTETQSVSECVAERRSVEAASPDRGVDAAGGGLIIKMKVDDKLDFLRAPVLAKYLHSRTGNGSLFDTLREYDALCKRYGKTLKADVVMAIANLFSDSLDQYRGDSGINKLVDDCDPLIFAALLHARLNVEKPGHGLVDALLELQNLITVDYNDQVPAALMGLYPGDINFDDMRSASPQAGAAEDVDGGDASVFDESITAEDKEAIVDLIITAMRSPKNQGPGFNAATLVSALFNNVEVKVNDPDAVFSPDARQTAKEQLRRLSDVILNSGDMFDGVLNRGQIHEMIEAISSKLMVLTVTSATPSRI